MSLANIVLHMDRHLVWMLESYGIWIYGVLFLIVFCETGLVVTPFLPGDSLLFVAGALSATGAISPFALLFSLSAAAIAGDSLNYRIGRMAGPKVFSERNSRFFKYEYLERTERFYEKYGGKTIVLARFVPIIRTFAPFVAGVGRMSYPRFIAYNVAGGVFWVAFFTFTGFYFGNIPIVKQNLSVVIMGIIILSIMPGVIEYWKSRSSPSP